MYRWIVAIALVILALTPAEPGQPKGKLVLDLWDVLYLEGGRAGFINTTTVEMQRDGKKSLRTTVDMHLSVKKNDQVVQLQAQTGTEETPDGRVSGTFMRQVLGPNKEVVITGVVKGKQLELILDGQPGAMKPAPWDDAVVGLYRQQSIFTGKSLKSGTTFSFPSFEPSVNQVVRMDVLVKGYEEVELLSKKKAKLLRVEIAGEKLAEVTLPKLVSWLDESRKPLKQETEIPGLGKIALFRTSREIALAPGAESTLTDIGVGQLVRLNKKIPTPHDTTEAVFRITVKGDQDAASAFARDVRQTVMNGRGATFDMRITATKGPKKALVAIKPGDEFTQSSYFITADDPTVKAHARKAVGTETNLWKKALAIEKWVHDNMRGSDLEVLATADHVARTLEGDCTEYAMLMAAMCRAEGIPSKTAIGLVYADTQVGPALGFHMWTEVWMESQWIPLDATLGRGFVGATHIKVTDHSWHDTRTLTPMLPISRVLGKLQIEVLSAK